MEKVRAFQKQADPVEFVTIDEAAMDTIRDIALKMLQDERGAIRPNVYLLRALHQYLTTKGVKVPFEVSL